MTLALTVIVVAIVIHDEVRYLDPVRYDRPRAARAALDGLRLQHDPQRGPRLRPPHSSRSGAPEQSDGLARGELGAADAPPRRAYSPRTLTGPRRRAALRVRGAESACDSVIGTLAACYWAS